MNLDLTILKNNLKTLFVDSPNQKVGLVQLWFKAGSALESGQDRGIAHFLEHMFFKGTKKRPGGQLAKEVESWGGEVNAFTSFDYTCYYINTPNEYLLQAIDIILDMVSSPLFRHHEIKPEREVVFEEYCRSFDGPQQFSFFCLQKRLFPKGYSHPILGTPANIKKFNDKQLKTFRKKFYNSSNALLLVGGDLKNKKSIIKKIEQYKLPKGPSSDFPNFKIKQKPTVGIHQKDVKMSQLILNIQAPIYLTQESAQEEFALNCMGHGESSPLYKKLVLESSLANSVSTSSLFLNKGGVHFIKVSCPTKNISEIYSLLLKEFSHYYDEGITATEINKLKSQYLASKVYEKESLESFCFPLGHSYVQTGDIHGEDKFLESVKNLTSSDIHQGIINIFKRPIHVSLQIPNEDDEKKCLGELEAFSHSLNNFTNKTSSEKLRPKIPTKSSKYDPSAQISEIIPGVKLIYRYNPLTPTFILQGHMRGGLSEETHNNNGIYQLLSGLLTKGHSGLEYTDIKKTLEERSAGLSGVSGKNSYGLSMHGQTKDTDCLFDHFFGHLLQPDMPNFYLNHEKEMSTRFINTKKKDPLKECFRLVSETIFQKHPYHRDILGTVENINSFTQNDLLDLHTKNIKQKEIVFTYCGDLEITQVHKYLEKYLVNHLSGRNYSNVQLHKPKSIYGEMHSLNFEREQTHLFLGIPSYSMNDPKGRFLKLLTTYYSGQSSPLFTELRDKEGLCYTTSPVNFSALEGGYWGIYMASRSEKINKAISGIKNLVSKLSEEGISKNEFEQLKKMIKGRFMLQIQTNEDYANLYNIPELYHLGLDFYYNEIKELNKIKVKDFNSFLQHFLNVNWNTILVGPQC